MAAFESAEPMARAPGLNEFRRRWDVEDILQSIERALRQFEAEELTPEGWAEKLFQCLRVCPQFPEMVGEVARLIPAKARVALIGAIEQRSVPSYTVEVVAYSNPRTPEEGARERDRESAMERS